MGWGRDGGARRYKWYAVRASDSHSGQALTVQLLDRYHCCRLCHHYLLQLPHPRPCYCHHQPPDPDVVHNQLLLFTTRLTRWLAHRLCLQDTATFVSLSGLSFKLVAKTKVQKYNYKKFELLWPFSLLLEIIIGLTKNTLIGFLEDCQEKKHTHQII